MNADRAVAARDQVLPESVAVATVANDGRRTAPEDHGGLRPAAAAELLGKTRARWELHNGRIQPRPGWLTCPVCGASDPVLRYWMYHRRPGNPTVPWRCDLGFKCSECAVGWWHGVAIPIGWWLGRPRPVGLRWLLSRGSSFEPKVWASDRGVRTRG